VSARRKAAPAEAGAGPRTRPASPGAGAAAAGRSPRGAQAVTRALRLLRAVAATDEPATLSSLAQTLGLSRTTAHRLLAALESEGFVTHAPGDQTYRPGPELAAFALHASPIHHLRTLARPLLEHLAETSGETATLELLTGNEVLIVDEVPSRRLVAAHTEIGTRWPLHVTSTGKALLASMAESEREAHLARPLVAFTPHSVTDRVALRRELATIRRRGYATAREEIEPGYAAVGAAFADAAGRPLGALSIGGPSSRMSGVDLDRLGPMAVSGASALQRRLQDRASDSPPAALRRA
jgi:DNA-binding IclR family transcriptional regulator